MKTRLTRVGHNHRQPKQQDVSLRGDLSIEASWPGSARPLSPEYERMVLRNSTDDSQCVEAVVLGAGPAGLAAAAALSDAGRRTALLDMGSGPYERDRDDAEDIVTGVGGAGLFSDGKFSFFPAGSRLWHLPDRGALEKAYAWFSSQLGEFAAIPPFPDIPQSLQNSEEIRELKTYPSIYLDFETRLAIVDRLMHRYTGKLITHAVVEQVLHTDDGGMLVTYRQGETTSVLKSAAVILAFGRLGGLNIGSQFPWLKSVFRRYEFGLRLEAPSGSFFLQNHECLDPKFILRDPSLPGIEWRTFCTCRDGEAVVTNFRGLRSYSGRSDVARTGLSNVGFNLRIKAEPGQQSKLMPEIVNTLEGKIDGFRLGLREYLRGNAEAYGPALDSLLRRGLELLLQDETDEFLVIGPCIEGVGKYPLIDENLQVPGAPLWIAGDQTGLFRGITAAFVSGHYVASQVNRVLSGPPHIQLRSKKRKPKISASR